MRVDFEELFNLHYRDVYRFALALCRDEKLAEDITQETFVRSLEHFESFKGNCRVNTWLCQIAKNLYFDGLKQGKKTQPGADVQSLPAPDFEDGMLDGEDAKKLHALLHTLPEPYKEVFTLRVFAELPFSQIGGLFEKNEGWARVAFYRAKQSLIKRMEES